MHDDAFDAISDDARGANDEAIDAAAAAMTAAPAPASLRAAVRRRIDAPRRGVPGRVWMPAVAAAALVVVAAWLWPQRPDVAGVPDAAVSGALSAGAPAAAPAPAAVVGAASVDSQRREPRPTVASGAVASGTDASGAVASGAAVAGARPAPAVAAAEPTRMAAADNAPTASDLVPLLRVEQLDVASLQPARLALDTVPIPMPLRIDRMEIEPLSLP